MKISLHWRYHLLLLGLVLAMAAPQAARGQNPNGSIRGIVQDASGARVAGAAVTAQSADTAARRMTSSDAQGEFQIADLPAGVYSIIIEAKGLARVKSEIVVAVSTVREISVTLKPTAGEQTVTVQGQASSISTQRVDSSSAVHQTIITAQDLDTIPLAARSFANIAYLAAGTEPLEPSDPTKARITAVSTGGSSGLNNEMSVDGADNTDDWIGGFLQNYSPESLEEFAFATAQEEAQTGRTTAASVVATTKRGSNNWHGDEALFVRDASLNARFPIDNPAPDPKQPFSRQNYLGTLGGPIIKDKLWVFGSLEYVHENASIAYSPGSQSEFNALGQLAQQGLINVDTANGPQTVRAIPVQQNVTVPFRDYLGLLRFDWAQSARSHWFLRTSFDSYTTHNALIQQATLPSTGATAHNNYTSVVIGNQFAFSPLWVGSLVLSGSGLHLTQSRNSNLGFALAFPFSSTSSTISGLETFGDQQFVTGITAFPVLRNQEKYQARYDVSHASGRHAPRFGVNFIHEPVMSGALTANAETLATFPQDPSFYLNNPAQFAADLAAGSESTPASDGSFSQNVQRAGFYAQDSWKATDKLTINYGVRYDTTFGLFTASGRSQSFNPALAGNGIVSGVPDDYRKALAPRLGMAYALGGSGNTVLRAGAGMYYADLAQNGWVEAFTAVNTGNLAGGTSPPSLIDPNYTTPYALHATAGIQHAFSAEWMLSADYTLETGMHGYRRYDYPNVSVFRTDNRSSYKALLVHLQGNVGRRLNLVANYTLASAKTWGCQIGELFDYVNGVCDPFQPFGAGDYGPSGEDVRNRGVLAGTVRAPQGFDVTFLFQAESARPITLTTSATGLRAVINGRETSLDEFRGAPYVQMDMRVARPFRFNERWSVSPFIEFFNLFNRNNPGNNYIGDVSALPTPVNDLGNVTSVCVDPPACTQNRAVTSGKQLLFPAGALGDFFGPGTTVGIPFAAQIGVRIAF